MPLTSPDARWIDHAPLALALVNDDFAFQAANQAFCALVQRTGEELRGLSYGAITHPDDLAGEIQGWLRLAEGAADISVEKRFVRGDGSAVRVRLRALPLHAEGARLGVLIAPHEAPIPAHASAADPAELQHARRDLGFVAAFASHDLRQQTRMVASFLGALDHHHAQQLGERGREFLRLALDHADRLGHLLSGLSEYVRAGLTRGPVAVVGCDEILDAALEGLTPLIKESGARITRDPLPRLAIEPEQMRRVFTHLIDNSLTHRGAHPPTIHVGCERAGDEWTFCVRDDGPGIPSEIRQRIFQPFLTTIGAPPEKRLGLGLALSRAAIERHAGRIWIEADTSGATVRFTLPAAPPG